MATFTYTGTYTTSMDDTYWYSYCKSGGTLTFTNGVLVDACIVGGGGGSGRRTWFDTAEEKYLYSGVAQL